MEGLGGLERREEKRRKYFGPKRDAKTDLVDPRWWLTNLREG